MKLGNDIEYDVYVAGCEYFGNKAIAMYWKNGVAVKLTDGSINTYAASIAVQSDDIYVAGYEKNAANKCIAKYWKNGVAIALTDSSIYSEANAIVVQDNDVYVAGKKITDNKSVAVYWKNGIAVELTNGSTHAGANDIVVQGNDIYVAGWEYNTRGTSIAKYWKNGIAVELTKKSIHNESLNAIAVQGNDVYVAGVDDTSGTMVYDEHMYVAKYWKNNVAVVLSGNLTGDTANACAIAAKGNDIYVAGHEDHCGKYWKNGVAIKIEKCSEIFSIAVQGEDVYMAGCTDSGAKYWKNGIAVELTDDSRDAIALAIAVVPRQKLLYENLNRK
jgi:hypothetical protein